VRVSPLKAIKGRIRGNEKAMRMEEQEEGRKSGRR
jgi:hypothetical protein